MPLSNAEFLQLYDRNGQALLRFFVRRTLDPEAAADLTAETIAVALESRASFDPTRGSANAWLFGIARHQLGRFARRVRVERSTADRLGFRHGQLSDDDHRQIEEFIDHQFLTQQLREGLADLNPEQRTAVWYRVVDQLSYEEIASRLGCSDQVARARVSRGLRRLASTLALPSALDQKGLIDGH